MRISDWSSDVCSSDLIGELLLRYRKVAFDEARGADRKAIMNFADQVGEPRERVAPPDVEQPFAADRRLDQYVDDDRARQRWPRPDRKSTRLNSSHSCASRMPSSALKKNSTKKT